MNPLYPLISVVTVVASVVIWHVASFTVDPTLVPGPLSVLDAALAGLSDGTLWTNISISLQRVFVGWILGSVIAIPLGILAGTSLVVRSAIDPFIHFFRFVPALALVSLFMLWFGIGEASKVNLIAYSSAFVVVVTVAGGASSIPEDKLDAARCFGATRWQVISQVATPASIPFIFVGMRLALANAFLVVVAAEALAAQSGIGFLVWNARTYFRTDQIFLGVLLFGVLGFVADRLWKLIGATLIARFLRKSGDY